MIARILRALSAEALKLRSRGLVRWAFLLAALASGASPLISGILDRAAALADGKRAASAGNGFLAFADAMKLGLSVGTIFLLIVAGLSLAEEHELGTAKVVYSKPLRRGEVVLGKALALFLAALLLVAVTGLASAASAGAAYGYEDVVERDARGATIYTYHDRQAMTAHALRSVPPLVPPLLAALGIAFLFSAWVEQSGIAVGLAMGALFLSSAAGFFVDRAAPWLPTSYLGLSLDTLRSFAVGETTADWGARWRGLPKGPPQLVLGTIVSLAWTALALVLASVTISRRAILGLLVTGGLALSLAGPGAPRALADDAGKVAFMTCDLEVSGQVWDVTVNDIDRDGVKDLLVLHLQGRRGPEPRRFLSVFYGRKSYPNYAKAPEQTFEIPDEACARFLGELVPEAPGLELGLVGTRGLVAIPREGRLFRLERQRRLASGIGFFDIAPGTQLVEWDASARDIDGDGRTDVLFPRKGTFDVLLQDGKGAMVPSGEVAAEFTQRFGTRIETLLLNRFINYWAGLAKPALVDIDGDRRLDLVSFKDQELQVFLARAPSGRTLTSLYAPDPDRRLPLRVLKEREEGDDSIDSVQVELEDIDKDGLPDLILYRSVGKVGFFESLRTQVMIHRARKPDPKFPHGFPDTPDQIINLKGVSINPALVDVDKDGDRDLVLSSLRTDLVTNAKRALFSSVQITYYVFRYDAKAGRYTEQPDYERDLSIDVQRIEGGGTIPLALFKGDFTGDDVPDLLSLEANDAVRILPGKAEKSFWSGETLTYDEDAQTIFAIETSNSVHVDDLDQSGKSDLLFWYFDKNWESKESGRLKAAMCK